jgi:hypothetical protein
MTTPTQCRAETAILGPTDEAVAKRAHFVASFVVHLLDAVYDRAGIDAATARSCPLPAGFLLDLGAVIQLALWEDAGLTVHIEAGLPTSDVAAKELERRAKLGPSAFATVTRLDLWFKVKEIWAEHFAWQGEEMFGAEIALARIDDDVLVNALADFLWRNRHIALTNEKEQQR